tara:strand:+ start:214 stop:444 length:231 start_codon:yes stop_codon:yes gene_type:complete
MDRNQSYDKWMNQMMEENTRSSKEIPRQRSPIKKSRSKQDLHLLSISELIYDNRQKISDNDYIQIMNHLKDLCNHK